MNTGQTMLTIVALAMLSILTMRYYGSIAQSGRTLSQSTSGLTATTIATSMIERAQNTDFDEITQFTPINQVLADPTLLTPYGSLGRDDITEDCLDSLDDFDDFNNWVDTVSPGWMNELYRIEFAVNYVDTANLNTIRYTQTFVKRLDIKVWRIFPPIDTADATVFDTARVSSIMGYYRFNN